MVGPSIVKTIRTINENYTNTSLVISGSFMHTMQAVALLPQSPLYKQLVNMEIKPLQRPAVADFVKKYLKRPCSDEALDLLLQVTNGIPYNLQILGREIDQLDAKSIDDSAIKQATRNLIEREGGIHFREYLSMMQSTEAKIVRTMAVFDVAGPSQIADAANMQLNDVTALLAGLLEKGIVRRMERGRYAFVDNLFKIWLKDYA